VRAAYFSLMGTVAGDGQRRVTITRCARWWSLDIRSRCGSRRNKRDVVVGEVWGGYCLQQDWARCVSSGKQPSD